MVKPGGKTPVSMQPRRKKLCETPCPRTQMEELMKSPSQHQSSHANSIYQLTGTKYCSTAMLACDPKIKTHIPVFTATATSTAVSRTGSLPVMTVRKSWGRDPWHKHSWIAHTQVKKFSKLRSCIAGAVNNTQAESMVCL